MKFHHIHESVLKATEHSEHFVHATYFALVTVEAHGHYRYAAGVLFLATIVKVALTHLSVFEVEK